MDYAVFKNDKQKKFMKEVKTKSKITWRELAEIYKISKRSLYLYQANKVLIPFELYLKFCVYIKIDKNKYQLTTKQINNKQKIFLKPKESKVFAEFLGALNGDGHLDPQTYELCIVSEKVLDEFYISKRVPYLIEKLFGLKSSIYIQDNLIKARIYSKGVINFLNKEYEIPLGKKLEKLKIPKFIFKNKKLQENYLRGLFDTDGTFYGRRNNEPVLGYTSLNPDYLNSVKDLLKIKGFNFGITGKDLYLYNRKQIDLFFKRIKPQNKKHLIKYNLFKKKGKILKTSELRNYMLRE